MTGVTVKRCSESGEGESVVYSVTVNHPAPPPDGTDKMYFVNESQFRTFGLGLGKVGKTDVTVDPEDSDKVIGVAVNA